MKNITVTTTVYNEEKRIENFLRSFQWSDDIIVVDKSSTDRTKEIAETFNAKVIKVPYSDTRGELKVAIEAAKNEWVMTLTASDMIHPELVDTLLDLINRENFDYDIIAMPFVAYNLGICDKHSPWFLGHKKWLFKKHIFSPCELIHNESKNLNSKKIYKMKADKINALYHFTHQDLDSFYDRCIRYSKAEVNKYKSMSSGLRTTTKELLLASMYMFFYKRTWLLGWNGIALMLAFMNYYIMKYLAIWEHFSGTGEEKYKKTQDNIIKQWDNKK